ncbi:MAG: NAD-dependent epimerase/dehydratase family protein [Terriglobales bacterium]
MNILITGASGNLGSYVVRHLLSGRHHLYLAFHKSPLPYDLTGHQQVTVRLMDLSQPETLPKACAGVDCVVHLAGVLFAPLPERFLPRTNVGYVRDLVKAARGAGVRKFILVSFPHAEGETTPDHPAVGRLDATPGVIHFRTRLEAERVLVDATKDGSMTAVIFRAGIVYGRGIKLTEGARWMLRHHLLAVWRKPTWAHLISLPDFLTALESAIELERAHGIYQVCDDGPLTIQDFLDRLADHYRAHRPWRLPEWMFRFAGVSCEVASLLFRVPAVLNRDIVKAGMTSCVADNSRMKRELLPVLAYPTVEQGFKLL